MIAFITGLQAEARLLRPLQAAVFTGGGGADGAARAVAEARAAGATALVSFGLAGGLDPALQPGTILVPRQVLWEGEAYATGPCLSAWLGGFSGDTLLAGTLIAATVADKRALFQQTQAGSVDLESGPVATSGLPFGVLRAICDPAGRTLPPAALAALNSAGAIGLGRVAGSLIRNPGQLPALVALARDAARARQALAARVASLAPLRAGQIAS